MNTGVVALAQTLLRLVLLTGLSAPAFAQDDAQLALGKKLFTQSEPPCGVCHTLAAAGAQGSVGPSLDELKPDAERVATAVRNGIGAMPPYEALSEEQIRALARYVAQASGAAR